MLGVRVEVLVDMMIEWSYQELAPFVVKQLSICVQLLCTNIVNMIKVFIRVERNYRKPTI